MVAAWFSSWLRDHIRRHEHLELPEPDDNPQLYDGLATSFVRYRVTEEEATDASKLLVSRRTNRNNHFAELVKLAKDRPKAEAKTEAAAAGPDYSKPESLSPRERAERIRLIRSELPTIEHIASLYPTNQWYAKAAAAGRAELTTLEDIERADRNRQRDRQLHPHAR